MVLPLRCPGDPVCSNIVPIDAAATSASAIVPGKSSPSACLAFDNPCHTIISGAVTKMLVRSALYDRISSNQRVRLSDEWIRSYVHRIGTSGSDATTHVRTIVRVDRGESRTNHRIQAHRSTG